MKIKIKRRNFTFTDEVDQILIQIQNKTDLTFSKIVEKGIKLFATEIKNNENK